MVPVQGACSGGKGFKLHPVYDSEMTRLMLAGLGVRLPLRLCMDLLKGFILICGSELQLSQHASFLFVLKSAATKDALDICSLWCSHALPRLICAFRRSNLARRPM